METPDIIDLAVRTLSTIVDDLQPNYQSSGGSLKLVWSDEPTVNASATPISKMGEPEIHEITINYHLVISLYKNIDNLFEYIDADNNREFFGNDDTDSLKKFFQTTDYKAFKNNSFISALTWVFFHELGHLKQGHIYILKSGLLNNFSESYSLSGSNFKNENTCLLHCLELAADHFATITVSGELARHFHDDLSQFEYSFATFVLGVSTAIYTFTGREFENIPKYPVGSHPPAIARLDITLSMMCEFFNAMGLIPNYDKRKYTEIAVLCSLYAYFYTHIKWHIEEGRNHKDKLHLNKNLTPTPLHLRENGKDYLKEILKVLDEIRPSLIKNLNSKWADIYALHFTDDFREVLFNS